MNDYYVPDEVREMLDLPITASSDDVIDAVRKLMEPSDPQAVATAIELLERQIAEARVELAELMAQRTDSLISSALQDGRIKAADEGLWRNLFASDFERAEEMLAATWPKPWSKR